MQDTRNQGLHNACEEFVKYSEELEKIREEQVMKIEEMDKQSKELDKKIEELRKKVEEQHKQIEAAVEALSKLGYSDEEIIQELHLSDKAAKTLGLLEE